MGILFSYDDNNTCQSTVSQAWLLFIKQIIPIDVEYANFEWHDNGVTVGYLFGLATAKFSW